MAFISVFHDSKRRGSRKLRQRSGAAIFGIYSSTYLWHIITPDGGDGVFGAGQIEILFWFTKGLHLLLLMDLRDVLNELAGWDISLAL